MIRSSDDLSLLLTKYDSLCETIIDKHAPMCMKKFILRPQVPWYNAEIATAKRIRRKCERRWRRTRLDVDRESFKLQSFLVTSLLSDAKRDYFTSVSESYFRLSTDSLVVRKMNSNHIQLHLLVQVWLRCFQTTSTKK